MTIIINIERLGFFKMKVLPSKKFKAMESSGSIKA